ncbi:unnamed protein product [Brassica napus]|nr:unnamed protein product [Brassica napus]
MAAQKQMLYQAQHDGSTDSLMESIGEMQTTMSQLHSSVGVLINSMAEILKSMTEMKSALQHTTTTTEKESTVTEVKQDLPDAPEKEEETRRIFTKRIEVEMPAFDGRQTQNLNQWIIKAERYFEFGDFTEKEKILVSSLSFDGPALNWFIVTERLQPFADWDDFKSQLLDRFGPLESAMSRLLALKQVGSVVEYLTKFEEIASELPKGKDRHEMFLEGVFVNGLREEIKDVLPLFQPKGLDEIIAQARRLENSRFLERLVMVPRDPREH